MSGQQAVTNVLGLEVNVKNGDHGIFVSQLLQAAEEETFRVQSAATPSSNQSGSRQEQDWEMTEGLLERKQFLQQKGQGSLSTSHSKKQPRRICWRNLSQPAPPNACWTAVPVGESLAQNSKGSQIPEVFCMWQSKLLTAGNRAWGCPWGKMRDYSRCPVAHSVQWLGVRKWRFLLDQNTRALDIKLVK